MHRLIHIIHNFFLFITCFFCGNLPRSFLYNSHKSTRFVPALLPRHTLPAFSGQNQAKAKKYLFSISIKGFQNKFRIIVKKFILYQLNFTTKNAIIGTSQEKGAMIMRYKITGRNINVTPGLKDAVEEKIGKLERYFNQDTEVIVTLSVEKDRQKIEVTIPVKGTIIRAEQESTDMYVSIDLVEEIIERQLKKYKTKLIDKKQAAVAFSDLFLNEEYAPADEIEIVKVKKFAMKPMDPEEACVQMELLGHAFYVFLNSETEQVNVVYKRKGNTYGLIEPEF